VPAPITSDEDGARVEATPDTETKERDDDRYGAFELEGRVLIVGWAMKRVAGWEWIRLTYFSSRPSAAASSLLPRSVTWTQQDRECPAR
jgi:hypothetical protein